MKTLTIGSTTLEINSFSKLRDKIVGVYAEIKIPTTAISHDDLKAMFTDNQCDLIVTEEDGSTATYSGYEELAELKENITNGVYTVIQICTSETMHLLNEARKRIETLETEKEKLQNRVTELQNISNEQTTVINTQAETITALNNELLSTQLALCDLYESNKTAESEVK